jgi:hypothetical protein
MMEKNHSLHGKERKKKGLGSYNPFQGHASNDLKTSHKLFLFRASLLPNKVTLGPSL